MYNINEKSVCARVSFISLPLYTYQKYKKISLGIMW